MNIESFREFRKRVRILERVVERHAQRLSKLEKAPASGEERHDPEMPDQVFDLVTLQKFARVITGEQFDQWLTAEEMRAACRNLRDALINAYGEFALHPRWQNTDERHLDAVYWLAGNAIVDFVRASTDPGRLSQKLQWLVFPEEG